MNRVTAIVLLLIGIILFLGSCAPIGYIIYHEAVIDPSGSISLSTEAGLIEKKTFKASPGTLARFTIEADITTSSVQEDPDSFDDVYLARFKFPITYTISNSSGERIDEDTVVLAWKDGSSINKSNEESSSTGGSLTASTNLDKFTVPADGYIDITIKIRPDVTYEATYTSPQLHFYEDMIDNTWYIVSGVLMFFSGFILAMVGFIFVLTNTAQVASQQSISQQYPGQNLTVNGELRDKETTQQAMFIQLSAFAGYIIPFGTIIVPVILWQVWRKNDPYIDTMGREAVNFQLSMALYYIICVLLFFILIGMVLIFAAMVFHLTFIIIAAVQTSRGADYRYPMTIRFIKE